MYLKNELIKKLNIDIDEYETINTLLVFSDTKDEFENNLYELIKIYSSEYSTLSDAINDISRKLVEYNGYMYTYCDYSYRDYFRNNLIKIESFLKGE